MQKSTLKKIGLIILIYSLLVFIGGVMGFAMKKSIPSLAMGSLCGLALLFFGIKTYTFHRWGLVCSTFLILTLDAFFSYRFLLTKTFFPAGAMLLLTTTILLLIMAFLKRLSRVSKNS